MKPYEKLRQYWDRWGADTQFAAIDEQIVTALEVRYDIRLPEDFRQYLLNCCPQSEDNMDRAMFSWWGLARIKNIPEEYSYEIANLEIRKNAEKSLFFADYCIWFWAWAIDCSDGKNRGRVIAIANGEYFITDSFTAFADSLVSDPEHYLGVLNLKDAKASS